MKTCRTYPTKHPHWIDEDETETRHGKAARRFRERTGISFPMAFAIVLGLHLLAVGGFYALSSSKKSHAAAIAAKAKPEKPVGPVSDALKQNDWPQTNASPRVVAKPPPVKPATPKSTPTTAPVKSPPPVVAKAAETSSPAKKTPAEPKSDLEDLKKLFLASRGAPVTAEKPAQPVVAQDSEVRAAMPVVPQAVEKPAQSSPAPSVSEYTLKPGDNLYMVSRKLEVSYNELMQANGLRDPRELRVGQKLKVPTRRESSM